MMLRLAGVLATFAVWASGASGQEVPPDAPAWLPRYRVDVKLDTGRRLAQVRQQVRFVNTTQRTFSQLVFNAHGRYSIPDDQVGFLAKMAEILRVAPREAMDFSGPLLQVTRAAAGGAEAPTRYGAQNPCSLEVTLPTPVGPGESAEVELEFTFRIPAKKGRWGQWNDVTALAQWLPTLAVVDDAGWHALPFIPWHQPFYNEAGVYDVRVTLPSEQKLAAPALVKATRPVEPGWTEIEFETTVLRDFSLAASARYQVAEGTVGDVAVRCYHLPEHAEYAKTFVQTACEAIPIYEHWLGKYPYKQFLIAEASFGWNGNECGGMVLIDDRMFNMPSIGRNYPIYLLQHELCHQWWYNLVGTNGYAETFMDEGMATHFSHRLADRTLGKNNPVLQYPKGLGWLPNIHRDDLRLYGVVGARARGDLHPTVQPIDQFGHLPNLLAHTYDRGGKIIGLVEQRLGEDAFLDFTRSLVRKYRWRILRVADFQKELETYTGRSWEEFFRHWVRGSGACDWRIARVDVDGREGPLLPFVRKRHPVRVVVDLEEREGFPEPTVLGVKLGGDAYALRIPIDTTVPIVSIPEWNAHVETRWDRSEGDPARATVRVTFDLPEGPSQIVVDPDQALMDVKPTNNAWAPQIRVRATPLYTQLEEIDVVNSYDRWNVIFGPWIWTATTTDPWYQRSPLAGAKLGVFRTQDTIAGVYAGYRSNDRNVVAGADALLDHFPHPRMQLGFTAERALTTLDENPAASRAALWSRYVMTYGSSLYMPPFEYVEAFAQVQDHPLPVPRVPVPGAEPMTRRAGVGLHYRKNLLTPYWDAEGGASIDLAYQYGLPVCGDHDDFHMVYGQVATVKSPPAWLGGSDPFSEYLRATRVAMRIGGGAALPRRNLFFALGGGDQFRGFDVRDRQGSATWVASVEWRMPLVQNVQWDSCDKIFSVRNVYLAPFYDAGQAYANGRSVGKTAHALGVGLRVDVQWLGIIERTVLRFDVARTLEGDAPTQLWFGFQHPF